jgi:hypothetical protein
MARIWYRQKARVGARAGSQTLRTGERNRLIALAVNDQDGSWRDLVYYVDGVFNVRYPYSHAGEPHHQIGPARSKSLRVNSAPP